MEQIELGAQLRSVTGKKVKRLRLQGLMPLVVYGRKSDSVPIQAVTTDVAQAFALSSGQLIALTIEGESEPRMVLARDIQRDFITGAYLHADLYQVDITETVQVEVPLAIVGEPHLVDIGEAVLSVVLNSVEIECLPTDIVQSFEVDVSTLVTMDDAIYVSDLDVPDSITVLTDQEEMIARLQYIIEEEEEEEEEEELFGLEPSVEDVEVIQRGADEEEYEDEEQG
jgi:large subunit ribosomal protein L25